jgi:hypothetical protein
MKKAHEEAYEQTIDFIPGGSTPGEVAALQL